LTEKKTALWDKKLTLSDRPPAVVQDLQTESTTGRFHFPNNFVFVEIAGSNKRRRLDRRNERLRKKTGRKGRQIKQWGRRKIEDIPKEQGRLGGIDTVERAEFFFQLTC
jgi:hypothetical protein